MENNFLLIKISLRLLLINGLAIFLILSNSCKKEQYTTNLPSFTISGHLYQDCSLKPVVGLKLSLVGGENGEHSGVEATSTTDSNGYFSFVFNCFGIGSQTIFYAAGYGYNAVMENIPSDTSIDKVVLFMQPTTNIQVCLNVINPHTISDTLIITNFQGTHQLKLPGPFSSGILYTAINYHLFDIYYGGEVKQLNWLFTPNLGQIFRKAFTVNKFCQDTIFVTADIN